MEGSEPRRLSLGGGKPNPKSACERCRASKVKCLRDDHQKQDKCLRCRSLGMDCFFPPLAPRRRRKRTDVRVTALEKELERVKSVYLAAQCTPPVPSFQSPSQPFIEPRLTTERIHQNVNAVYTRSDIFSGIIPQHMSKQMATQLLSDFLEEVVSQWPIISMGEDDSFDSLHTMKPLVLLAAVTAASCAKSGELFERLHSHLVEQLVSRAIVMGEKSLELVQAIMIMEVWYCPPDDLQRLNFYQWIHIAATMTLYLGLGGEQVERESVCQGGEEYDIPTASPRQEMEGASVLLGVYLSCSCVAVNLRRENVLNLTPSTQKCLQKFGELASAVNDRRLLAWVQLQLIAEEVHTMMPDQRHVRGSALMSSLHLESEIRRLEHLFDAWSRSLDADITNESLMVHFQYCKAKLFEIPMHLNHDFEGIVPPFLSMPQRLPRMKQRTDLLSSAYVRAVGTFVTACHATMDAFLVIAPDVLQRCPTVTYMRALYAIKALLALHDALELPMHDLLGSLESRSFRIEEYIPLMETHLLAAASHQNCKIPSKILQIWDQITQRNHREALWDPDFGQELLGTGVFALETTQFGFDSGYMDFADFVPDSEIYPALAPELCGQPIPFAPHIP